MQATSSLLEMEATSLIKLTMDPKGSHIIDAFFKSSTIGEKNKEKLLNKFKVRICWFIRGYQLIVILLIKFLILLV